MSDQQQQPTLKEQLVATVAMTVNAARTGDANLINLAGGQLKALLLRIDVVEVEAEAVASDS